MIKRSALWLVTSSLLLLVGFSLVVLGMYVLITTLGTLEAEQIRKLQLLMTFYFRIVFLQGLLPGLVLTLVLWPGVVHVLPRAKESRARLFGGLLLASSLAYAVVAPLLLTTEVWGVPGLQMEDALDYIGSAVGIAGGVAVAAWLPRAFLPALR